MRQDPGQIKQMNAEGMGPSAIWKTERYIPLSTDIVSATRHVRKCQERTHAALHIPPHVAGSARRNGRAVRRERKTLSHRMRIVSSVGRRLPQRSRGLFLVTAVIALTPSALGADRVRASSVLAPQSARFPASRTKHQGCALSQSRGAAPYRRSSPHRSRLLGPGSAGG